MRVTIEYDNEMNLLRISASEQFDLNSLHETMDKIVNSSDYPPTVTTIWDLCELDFTKIEKHVERQVTLARKKYPQRKGAKIAYVVSNQLGFGMMRMLETLIEDEETDQKVFYDYSEAEKWIIKTV